MPQAMACGTVIGGLTPPQSRLSPPEQKSTPPERRCDSCLRVTKGSRIEIKVSKSSVTKSLVAPNHLVSCDFFALLIELF